MLRAFDFHCFKVIPTLFHAVLRMEDKVNNSMLFYRVSLCFLEAPCWKKWQENQARFGDNPPADFANPICDKNGYFKPRQCFPLAGCHCVDKYGIRTHCEKSGLLIRGTKPLPPRSSPTSQRTPTGTVVAGR